MYKEKNNNDDKIGDQFLCYIGNSIFFLPQYITNKHHASITKKSGPRTGHKAIPRNKNPVEDNSYSCTYYRNVGARLCFIP